MRTTTKCRECGKQYRYTAWLGKHYDNIHPELAKTPIDIIACINREWAMKAIEEEAKTWISDPRLRTSFKYGLMPT